METTEMYTGSKQNQSLYFHISGGNHAAQKEGKALELQGLRITNTNGMRLCDSEKPIFFCHRNNTA
jgi:hypothetical protein